MPAMTEGHKVEFTTTARQLGRSRITDHHWSCECSAKSTAPTGFSTRHDAFVDSLGHRQR